MSSSLTNKVNTKSFIDGSYFRTDWIVEGITPVPWTMSEHVVVYPSDSDLVDTIQDARKNRNREAARVHASNTRADLLRVSGMTTKRDEDALKKAKKRLEDATRTVNALNDWEPFYGRVFASSGFVVAPSGCSLDWALVCVPTKSTNHVSNCSKFESIFD